METKYVFSTAGVAQWQEKMMGASPIQQNEEASRVEQGLYSFLPRRFEMGAGQVAYLDDLPPALCHLWATQIAYALREGIPIELIKPEAKAAREHDGTKFIESEGNTGTQPGQSLLGPGPAEGYFLRFTVGYY